MIARRVAVRFNPPAVAVEVEDDAGELRVEEVEMDDETASGGLQAVLSEIEKRGDGCREAFSG